MEKNNLKLTQRIRLKIWGYVFSHYEQREGWKAFLPMYIVKCSKHGLYHDYVHGFRGREHFTCPRCKEEMIAKLKKEQTT